MSPKSVGEMELMLEQFSMADTRLGSTPHYIDRSEAYRESAKLTKRKGGSPTEVSETLGAVYLAPRKASILLRQMPAFDDVPKTLDGEKNLRRSAHELAQEIIAVDDPNMIPILSRFIGGLDIDRLNQRDIVSEAITEKVAILSLYKIIELVGKNKGKVDCELPDQAKEYIETIRRVKEMAYSLEELAESNQVLNRPMDEVVSGDEKWAEQDAMEAVIKKQQETQLGGRVFQIAAGVGHYLRRAIQYSQMWEKEGLSPDEIYHLTGEQIDNLVKVGARYFSWYSLLDDQWIGEAETNYDDDFQAFTRIFIDKDDPNFIGNLIPPETLQSVRTELEAVDKALFE